MTTSRGPSRRGLLLAAAVTIVAVAGDGSAYPLARDASGPIAWRPAVTVGAWKAESEWLSLESAARRRNYYIVDAEPSRAPFVRMQIDDAKHADIALLLRANVVRAEPALRLEAYGIAVNARRKELSVLRWDAYGVRDPAVRTPVPGLRDVERAELVVVTSGPQLMATLYDADTQEVLGAVAWSDVAYAKGTLGIYAHRATPSSVRVRLEAMPDDVPTSHAGDEAAPVVTPEWLVRLPADYRVPRALRSMLRRAHTPPDGERVYTSTETGVARARAEGVPILGARPAVAFKHRDRDFAARHKAELKRTRTSFRFVDGLKDAELIERHIKAFAERFPEQTRLLEVGRTHQGRVIWGLRIADDPDDKDRPSVLLCAAHHGNEAVTPEFPLDAARYLLENRRSRTVRRWLAELAVVVVPLVNPDGNMAFWHVSERFGRKNRHPHEGFDLSRPDPDLHDLGVDLNRNYPFGWRNVQDRYNNDEPLSSFYRGPSAGSEPEVQAMMALAEEERFLAVVSYHAAATKVLVPYTIEGADNPEPSVAWSIAEEMEKELPHKFRGRRYDMVRNLYPVGGVDQDWHMWAHGSQAYLVEVPRSVPRRQRELDEMVLHSRPIWQVLLDRWSKGPSLALRVVGDATEGGAEAAVSPAPVEAEVVLDEEELKNDEVWTTSPTTGRMFRYLAGPGPWTVRARAAGREAVEVVEAKRGVAEVTLELGEPAAEPEAETAAQ